MTNMLYRAGTEIKVNNDLWCDTLTVEDDEVEAALADGWFRHYSETAPASVPAARKRGAPKAEPAPEPEPEPEPQAE